MKKIEKYLGGGRARGRAQRRLVVPLLGGGPVRKPLRLSYRAGCQRPANLIANLTHPGIATYPPHRTGGLELTQSASDRNCRDERRAWRQPLQRSAPSA